MNPRERCIRLLLRLLANPYRFTLKELAVHFEQITTEGVKEDIQILRHAGLQVDIQRKNGHRYAVLPHNGFKELAYLQPLSDADRALIGRALDYLNKKESIYLNQKLDSLYDFQKLGLRALRRPALERIDRLEAAKNAKKQARLVQYRSNSGSIQDRIVEPFHIDPELDTLQAYDLSREGSGSKHFLLSRIERVYILEEAWSHESEHRFQKTDVFRIANNRQKMVQMQLDVYAYNALVGAYPKALSEISPGAEPLTYEFQSMVNKDFLGLVNFILGNAAMSVIEIVAPEELKAKVQTLAKEIVKKNEVVSK